MNMSMTSEEAALAPSERPYTMPIPVQIISTLMFGAFAIVAVVLAFNAFWVAGVLLAAILGWRGGFAPRSIAPHSKDDMTQKARDLRPEAQFRSSGNASFDAYRVDMLRRLEHEQTKFEGFLSRLRDAKDRTEFDHFLDERAEKQIRAEASH